MFKKVTLGEKKGAQNENVLIHRYVYSFFFHQSLSIHPSSVHPYHYDIPSSITPSVASGKPSRAYSENAARRPSPTTVMAAATRDEPEVGGCVSMGAVMVPLVVALEGLADVEGLADAEGATTTALDVGSSFSGAAEVGAGVAVVSGAAVVGGEMSTPADLHRTTAAASAFCWSETSHSEWMHSFALSKNAELEHEHLKSVRLHPVALTFPVRQAIPHSGKASSWAEATTARVATMATVENFILTLFRGVLLKRVWEGR